MPNFKDLLKEELSRLIDPLNRFILVLYIISFIISIFISNLIVDLIPFIFIIIFIFRLVSKNKYQRNKENKLYLKIKGFLFKPFTNLIRNIKDKNNIYRRCHKCKTTLKLPLPDKRGLKHTKCPKCGKKITFYTFRQTKIEVIKKKRV